jgi:hypothetical protein
MEFVRSTPVTRSWKNTLATLLFALVTLALGALILYLSRDVKPVLMAIVFFLFSMLGFWTAATHSYTGDCPACGTRQKRLGGLHRCNHCPAYGEVVKGEYREIETDRICNAPVFAARIPEPCQMPGLCSGCGLPAARLARLRIIRKEFALDLDVPHCDLHPAGADLATERAGNKSGNEVPVLKVASYRFYREFLKQNKIYN